MQRFLMVLLLIDAMLLFVELYLSAEFPACKVIKRDTLVWRPERGETEELKGEEKIFRNVFFPHFLVDQQLIKLDSVMTTKCSLFSAVIK